MKQPNIIFLMTDQHRWDALGCVNSAVKTPHLDRLAAGGVRFGQAVCNAPMCIPSRYSMMLGMYPSQSGVRHNSQFIPNDMLLPGRVIPQQLADLGYQTAGFGKTHWYLGSRLQPPGTETKPSRRGFEVRAQARDADPANAAPGSCIMGVDEPEALARLTEETRAFGGGGEGVNGYLGCTSTVPGELHREGWLTGKCLQFLDRDRDASRPLFLYLSFDFPHAGFNVPKGYEELYNLDDIPARPHPPWGVEPAGHVGPDLRRDAWASLSPEEQRRSTLRYYALCSYVDAQFGRVLDKLQAQGELANSLILFTSDHGDMLGDRGHRFSKYCLYDPSVRVPLIICGSAVPASAGGLVDDRPAELVDILPTLVEAAGGTPDPRLPGRSLLGPPGRCGAFCEMHGSGYEILETHLGSNWLDGTFRQAAPALMWRTKEWKLILSIPGWNGDAATRLDECRGELYDLREDPGEWNNLYDEPTHAATRERLTRELLLHFAVSASRYPYQPARTRISDE